MKTVILKWNPAISSYSMLHYLSDIRMLNVSGMSNFNWSVWDYEQIHEIDKFYWLKVGQHGQVGIVGTGTITSEPYTGEDWSGNGRQTYYVEYEAEMLLNPDAMPILTAEKLQEAIPDFEWTGGHSGMVLTDEQATKLDALWNDFVKENNETFEKAQNLGRGDSDLIFIKGEEEEQEEDDFLEEDEQDAENEDMALIVSNAESGIWSEEIRDLVDGFDEINGTVGSFHDSELLSVSIDHDTRTAIMKFHMMNGVNLFLTLLFEKVEEYEFNAYDLSYATYLDFGYFVRQGDTILFQLDGYGSISAGRMKVLSVEPIEE